MILYENVKQGSEAWDQLRLGIPTASAFHRIMTPKTRKLSSQSEGYMHQLLAEWIFGQPLETFESPWMERGKALEAEAVRYYEMERDCTAREVGFCLTDDRMVGASPDRLVGDVGLLEIKCPSPAVHVGFMLTRAADQEYLCQLQGQLWVSEREWVDIQSYCPPFPSVVIRVPRDEKFIADLSVCVRSFVDVLLATREKLTQAYGDCRQKPLPREPLPEIPDEFWRGVV